MTTTTNKEEGIKNGNNNINNNNGNPKSVRRMGSLGERARTFFSKFKTKDKKKSSNSSTTTSNNKNKSSSIVIEEEEEEQQENSNKHHHDHDHDDDDNVEDVVIVGAGIVGLVLALYLHTHAGITPKVYEQAEAFHDDVGAGMGMYPNGLRVIRDISPDLLKDVQEAGYPYLYRRWERHDGTEVAVSNESILTTNNNPNNGSTEQEQEDDPDLQPLGIKRWRLQKLLYQAAEASGIPIYFAKRLENLERLENNNKTVVRLTFTDGTIVVTRVLLGADGSKSRVRNTCCCTTTMPLEMRYTGVTCLMGTSNVPRADRGICLPASETTNCHGAFYPTGPAEQCFQFHFPTSKEDAAKASEGSWGTLTEHVGQEECNELRERLRADGWDEKYLQPLGQVDKAIKIGFSILDPPLDSYVHQEGSVVLVGDAAHPPVPYLGQGAQQGLEDAGTLALLFEHFLMVDDPSLSSSKSSSTPAPSPGGQEMAPEIHSSRPSKKFSTANLPTALKLYNALRVPRTQSVLENSKLWGKTQQKRTECPRYNRVKEQKIQREVFFHETVSDLFLGVHHDYKEEALKVIREAPLSATAIPGDEEVIS